MRPHDIRMFAELHPQPAFRGETADADTASQQLAPKGLERNHLGARTIHLVVDHVHQAHTAFVNVEDLEPAANPVSHAQRARHEKYLPPAALCPRNIPFWISSARDCPDASLYVQGIL